MSKAANSRHLDQPIAMDEDYPRDKAPIEAQLQKVRHAKRRPQDSKANSHDTADYDQRVVSVRFALRSALPSSRQRIVKEYDALLVEGPLVLPLTGGKMHSSDPYAIYSSPPRPVASAPQRPRPPPSRECIRVLRSCG
jgi:hypothetical protein